MIKREIYNKIEELKSFYFDLEKINKRAEHFLKKRGKNE